MSNDQWDLWFSILLWLPPLLHHWNFTCFLGSAPVLQQRTKVKIKTFLSKQSGELLINIGFVNSCACCMIWKYNWLRDQSPASKNGRNCVFVIRANTGLYQVKIFLEVVYWFTSMKITSWDAPLLRRFVQSVVLPEQNTLAGQWKEHQKSSLSRSWAEWAVPGSEPSRSFPGVCRALVLLAGWHVHSFGKARGNFKRSSPLKQTSLPYSSTAEPFTEEIYPDPTPFYLFSLSHHAIYP